jgi:hypothetical protein
MTDPTPKSKRERFLPEEDDRLRALVAQYGATAWEAITAQMPGRNLRQVRERWKHYLSSERGKAPWTGEENRLLVEKMQAIGPRWTQLALFFPGRTDIDVKTHWMQSFARYSNLHMANRRRGPPLLESTVACTVQFAPNAGPPRAEECSLQSYFDLGQGGF